MGKDYCLDTSYIYKLKGDSGVLSMQSVMKMFRCGFKTIGGIEVERILDHKDDPAELSGSGAVEYRLTGGSSVIIKPSGTGPMIETSISIGSGSKENAAEIEERIRLDLENIIYLDYRSGYCCE